MNPYHWSGKQIAATMVYPAGTLTACGLSMDLSTGRLLKFQMTPTRVQRFRMHRAAKDEAQWLTDVLTREGEKLGTRIVWNEDNTLTLQWGQNENDKSAS